VAGVPKMALDNHRYPNLFLFLLPKQRLYILKNMCMCVCVCVCVYVCVCVCIEGVPGGKVNVLGGHCIGHSKQNALSNMCPIPNGLRDRAI
jgi:hypothetical protein